MPQLLSHLFILGFLYRRLKIFFKEWNAWYILFMWATLYMFFMFAIYTTFFWAFLGPSTMPTLRLLSFISLFFLIIQIFILTLFRLISRDNPTEWWWGYIFWFGRLLFLRKLAARIKERNRRFYTHVWFEYWITTRISELHIIALILITFKTFLLFLFLGCITNYVDTPTLSICFLKIIVGIFCILSRIKHGE